MKWFIETIDLKRLVFFLMPLSIIIIYVTCFANEKYRSNSSYMIRDLSANESLGVDLGIFGTSASSQTQDANIVVEYLRSMDMLKKLDRRFNLKAYYGSDKTEPLERLYWFATQEDLLELYRKNLSIVPDELTGLTHIAFESTDPERAATILRFLLDAGETFLNQLNRQRAEKKIAFAQSQLEQNKTKLDAAIAVLESFQNEHRLVDPSADVAIKNNIIANIETSIVERTAEYNQLISYMSRDSIDALKLQKQIDELKTALDKTKSKLSGADPKRLNDLLFEYQKLKNEVDFATEVYKKTLVQYEASRIEAMQQSKIFEVIAAPHLPDGSVYPKRLRIILTSFLIILGIYKITRLVLAVVKDHKD